MSDDEDVLFDVGNKASSNVGLINNKAKNVADILEAPVEDRRLKKTICLCGAFVSVGLCISVLGPTLPFLEAQTGSTPSHLGYVFLGRGFGYFVGSILAGCLFEVLNPMMFLGTSLAACTVSMSLIPSASDVSMIMFLFVFVGMAMGSLDTGANVVCLRLWGKRSPPFMQALHFSFAVGALLAPLLVKPYLNTALASCNLNEVRESADSNRVTTINTPDLTTSYFHYTTDSLIDAMNYTEASTDEYNSSDSSFDITTDQTESSTPNPTTPIKTTSKANKDPDVFTEESSADTFLSNTTDQTESTPIPTSPIKTTSKSSQTLQNVTDPESANDTASALAGITTSNTTAQNGSEALNETDNAGSGCQSESDLKIAYTYYTIAIFVAFNSLIFFYFSLTSPKKKTHHPLQRSLSVSGSVFGSQFNQQMLSIMFVFYFLYVGAEMAYGSFIFSFAIDSELQMSEEEASLLNSAFWISFAMSRGFAICCAGYIPPFYLLAADMVGCLISSIVLLVYGGTNSLVLWFGTIFLGASMASLFPTGLSWLEQHLKVTGKAAAILVIGAASGEMVIPFLVGQYFPDDGAESKVDVLMYMMLVVSVALPLLFYVANSVAESRVDLHAHLNRPGKETIVTHQIVEAVIAEANNQKNISRKNGKRMFSSKTHKE